MMLSLHLLFQTSLCPVLVSSFRACAVLDVTRFVVGVSSDCLRFCLIIFDRWWLSLAVGMPCSAKIRSVRSDVETLYFLEKSNRILSMSSFALEHSQMCWLVSSASKHLGHVSVSYIIHLLLRIFMIGSVL